MLYAVGTHIDLRYLNEQKVEQAQVQPEARRQPAGYPVGTKILFVRNLSELTVLKITPKLFVVNQALGA
jgi:hypothetical protein